MELPKNSQLLSQIFKITMKRIFSFYRIQLLELFLEIQEGICDHSNKTIEKLISQETMQ